MKKLTLLALAGFSLGAIGCITDEEFNIEPCDEYGTQVGQCIENFELEDKDYEWHSFNEYKRDNRLLILTMPFVPFENKNEFLNELQGEYDVEVYVVHHSSYPSHLESWEENYPNEYIVLADTYDLLKDRFNDGFTQNYVIPHVVLVDEENFIKYRVNGVFEEGIEYVLEELE